MYDQLAAVDTSRTSWRVKVRVTRMWPSLSASSDSKDPVRGYNLILLDDDNSHMHAFVYTDIWRKISDDMVEGGLYVITNFYTKEATGNQRPTSAKFIINFSNSTVVEKLEEDDFMIPNHKFEFIDLSDLFRVASSFENPESPEFATDVIGVVEDFEDVKPISTVYGDRKIVKFRITDGRYSHKVTVWGQLAVTTDELFHSIEQTPIIAIVTTTKMRIFKNSVQLNTLPGSKIYLNLDDEVVNSMRIRLEEEGYKAPETRMESPVQSIPVPVIETITVKQLYEKTTTDDTHRLFLCNVKISNVEEGENWWFHSCTDCQAEVYKLEGRYKCLKCPKSIPIAEKRFKIIVLAGDSTEACNFILSDRASKRIVRQTATKMIADTTKNEAGSAYPTKIKEIAGKDFTFKVEISDDNVLLQSKIFNVVDAYDQASCSSGSSFASKLDCSSIGSFSESMIDLTKCGDMPGSPNSVSKKPKMEN